MGDQRTVVRVEYWDHVSARGKPTLSDKKVQSQVIDLLLKVETPRKVSNGTAVNGLRGLVKEISTRFFYATQKVC